jgi:hypothetical protein
MTSKDMTSGILKAHQVIINGRLTPIHDSEVVEELAAGVEVQLRLGQRHDVGADALVELGAFEAHHPERSSDLVQLHELECCVVAQHPATELRIFN